ncbi:MAG: HAD-IIA family hydrolase [Armatimonadota bacterium]|nr:HAD-IIA family hydrolase [Armatimonadota bacterium]
MERVRAARGFLLDVDGCLMLGQEAGGSGGQPLPGAVELVSRLKAEGRKVLCFTNSTGQAPAENAQALRRAGFDLTDQEFMTPAVVAAEYLRRHHPEARVLAIGGRGITAPLEERGLTLVPLEAARDASVVLVGRDTDFSYRKLEAGCQAVWSGASLLVTSNARWLPVRGGKVPGTGAIVAGIAYATETEPLVLGKPSPLVLQIVGEVLGLAPTELAVVGDDLELEVRMGRAGGAFTVLVLSGATREEDLRDLPRELRPDLVVSDVGELNRMLDGGG